MTTAGARAPAPVDRQGVVQTTRERAQKGSSDEWEVALRSAFSVRGNAPIHLVGVGNPIRQDDAVGLVVVSLLRKKFGGSPRPWLKIHRASSDPERLLSKFSSKAERMIVFDAVDAGRPPGTIVCANLADTKFGFFATHNVPLRIIPGVAERLEAVTVVGVQPKSIDVVEGLTETVSEASERLVGSCEAIIGGTGND